MTHVLARFRSPRTVLCSVALIWSSWQVAALAESPKQPTAKLKRLPKATATLKAPAEVSGKFSVAGEPCQIDFAVFPGQWEGARLWSSWGDALFASDGKFYTSIGDHAAPHGTAYVYQVDPKQGTVRQVVDYNSVIDAKPEKYSPGKIHGNLVDAENGWIYFLGYRGSVRRTTAEADFRGDWLLRYHLESGRTENLGIPVPHCSTPVLHYCAENQSLYALCVPGKTLPEGQDRFVRYSLADRKLLVNGGPVPSMSRAMVVTEDGRAYYSHQDEKSGGQILVRYNPQSNDFTKLKTTTPGEGPMRAASRPNSQGVAYCISRGGMLYSFDTQSEKTRALKSAFVHGPLYTATCRLDPTETYLYYLPGAHGRSSQAGTPVIQYNVKTGKIKVLAFLHDFLREHENYHLGGTYGIALNADGSQLMVNFNGNHADQKKPDFGLCSVVVLHIPKSERDGS